MKFKTYLKENTYNTKKVLKDKEFFKIAKDYSSAIEQYKKGNIIYRGLDIRSDSFDIYHFNSIDNTERRSRNTDNYYTILINHLLPSFKEYPKRQIICSFDDGIALNYGDLFIVLPKNKSKIGVVPKQDIWDVRTEGKHYFEEYNKEFKLLFYHVLGEKALEEKVSLKLFKELINKIDNLKNLDLYDHNNPAIITSPAMIRTAMFTLRTAFDYHHNSRISFLDHLDKNIYNAKKLGFKLGTIENLHSIINKTNECWLDTEVIYIKPDKIKELIGKL